MTPPSPAGGVDWAEHWRHLVERRRERIDALRGSGPEQGYWDRRADWFARLSREVEPGTDTLIEMLTRELAGGGTLLDVGAGAGATPFR
ncbi:MAG: hypothetical protein WKH64_01070 [Chloroflexia bacterium]